MKATESGLLERLRVRTGPALVMGVVNATPDSFFAGSRAAGAEAVVERALRLRDEGADIVDLGGQSTRPGAEPVSIDEELARVLPAVEALAGRLGVPLSIDTDKPEVASRCREAGAAMLNDVAGLRGAGMLEQAARFEAVVVMHMLGESPKTMQLDPGYGDVVAEVYSFLSSRRQAFVAAGGDAARLVFDPGIGFGKTLEHNLSLIKNLDYFSKLGPVLLGASRKSFLGKVLREDPAAAQPEGRVEGSLAAACWGASRGARVLRVHDVAETRRALAVVAAIQGAR